VALSAADWTDAACAADGVTASATVSATDDFTLCLAAGLGVNRAAADFSGAGKELAGTVQITGLLTSNVNITLGGATTLSGNLTMEAGTLALGANVLTLPATKTLTFNGTSLATTGAAAHVLAGSIVQNSTGAVNLGAATTKVIGGSVTQDLSGGATGALTLPAGLTTITGALTILETGTALPATLTTIGGKVTTAVNQTIPAATTSIGSIDVTGGTLLLADSAPNTRTISGDVKTATALVTRVTDIIYGNLEITANVAITGPTKLSDGDHSITFPAAAATYSSLDLSSLTSGKKITLLGGAGVVNTITAITYPVASGVTKTFEIVAPAADNVVFTNALTNCIDKSTAAAPTAIGSPLSAGKTALCTVAASSVAAPIFSTQEKGKVFVDEVK
jgi:hypothetical protein